MGDVGAVGAVGREGLALTGAVSLVGAGRSDAKKCP